MISTNPMSQIQPRFFTEPESRPGAPIHPPVKSVQQIVMEARLVMLVVAFGSFITGFALALWLA